MYALETGAFAARLKRCALLLAFFVLVQPIPAAAQHALVIDFNGAVGPPIADFITREIKAASSGEVRIVILRMNTPGGLDRSMREIIRAILASPVPVATYVAPSGARAASAGTYIAYASAIAAMAPGTNIGAATPVQLGAPSLLPGGQQPGGEKAAKPAEPADAEQRKILNDAVAYIRSLAALNGRNADWAADAVIKAESLPAAEALKLGVIDVVAEDVPDLLRKIDGRTVVAAGQRPRLATAGLPITTVAPGWRTAFLATITDPNIAFILMLIGIYGLIFEFLSPGAVAPGLVGGISLLVALYALSLLPINLAGVALVLLGIGLMVAEVHIGAFGILGIGGVIAFVIGAIMMFPEGQPGLELSPLVIAAATLLVVLLILVVLAMFIGSRRRRIVTGREALVGSVGEIVSWQGMEGRVRIEGEVWRAHADAPLLPGKRVRIIGREGLVLAVEPQ